MSEGKVFEENHDLSDFLKDFEGTSGVYLISPNYDETADPDEPVLVKVGLSRAQTDLKGKKYGGLGRRLDSYLLCFPTGFSIFAILQTQSQYAYQIENWIQSYFTAKQYKLVYSHSRVEEWYWVKPNDVYATLAAMMRNPDLKGFIPKYNFYKPALYLDTNGRQAQHPKKALSDEEKVIFETYISPGKVPQTLRAERNPVENMDMEEGYDESSENPVRKLEFDDG